LENAVELVSRKRFSNEKKQMPTLVDQHIRILLKECYSQKFFHICDWPGLHRYDRTVWYDYD